MLRDHKIVLIFCLVVLIFSCRNVEEKETILVPEIDGEWWEVSGNPRDHKYATERQEPVDFAVWQAADRTWQMWPCFRFALKQGSLEGMRCAKLKWAKKKDSFTAGLLR